MSESEALSYLGLDKRALNILVGERRIRRHPKFRALFSRAEVESLAKELAQEISSTKSTPSSGYKLTADVEL